MLLVVLKDYLKKIASDKDEHAKNDTEDVDVIEEGIYVENDTVNEIENDNEKIEDTTDDANTEEKYQNQISVGNIIKSQREQKKQQKLLKKEAKKKRNKHGFYYVLAMIVVFSAFILIKSTTYVTAKSYVLNGSLQYSAYQDMFEIKYDIESLKNNAGFKTGQEVCIPANLTSDDRIVVQNENCVSGTITSASGRVKITYPGLQKYISYEELRLYLKKEYFEAANSVIKVKVTLKKIGDSYKIVSIIPK